MKNWLTLLFSVSLFASQAMAKDLIIYFTQPEKVSVADAYSGASAIERNDEIIGTTEYIAQEIQKHTGADLFRLEDDQDYPLHSHSAMLDFGQEMQRKNVRPVLKNVPNIAEYDRIFVGFPIWWYKMPMAYYTLFGQQDFSGKEIHIFATSGGARFSGTAQEIRRLQPNATVFEGFETNALYRTPKTSERVEKNIANWLAELGNH